MKKIDKLVLIIPPSPWLISDRDIPMLGVLYLAAYVKPLCEVVVCDLSGLPEKYWFIPVGDLYGITGVSPQFIYIKKIIELLKGREPHKSVIAGGVHATVLPEHILNNTLADACILGDGEVALSNIIRGDDWKDIENLQTRNCKGIICNGLPHVFHPDRRAIDYYSYLVPRTFGYMADVGREASIITGRGCPYSCAFCASKKMHGNKPVFNPAHAVVDEFLQLRDEFGVEMVNVLDDTFILNKKRVYDICQGLKGQGIKWFCLTRVDHVDKELLVEMKEAGCLSLAIGFETGSNRMLEFLNKKATVKQAKECVKIAKEVGFLVNGQLMVGLPTETEGDVELTRKFIESTPEVDTFGLHMFQPYPGSDIWEHPEKYGITINKDTDFSDYHTIGKHDGEYHSDPILDNRYRYLKTVIGNRSRELRK